MTQKQQELVNENLNLVYSITSRYHVPASDREDLIQEAIESLCLAAQRFDPTRGEKFVTYAYSYISGRCKYFISRNAIIKPVRTKESNYKKFVTYEIKDLDDYSYIKGKDLELDESSKEVLQEIEEYHGVSARKLIELLRDGYGIRECCKILQIKRTEAIQIIEDIKKDEVLLDIFKE